MTIAHVATGARTTGNAGTTSTAVPRPATGNVAGNLTVVGRAIKPDTATGTTLAGWTRATNGAGGTGTTGLDVGLTRIVTDWQELVGGETGSVTFAQGTSPNSVASCMITYSRTGSSWAVDSSVGNDSTHGTGRAATGGALDLMVGDVIVAFVASDTDDATAYTAPAITASGMTITTTLRLGAGGVSQNNDCGIAIYEGVITAGTQATVAPAIALTGGPSSCGPVAFVRLREVLPPTITQASYRFYGDGTETGSTALASQDTAYGVNITGGNVNMQLRVRLQSTNAVAIGATDDFVLQFEKNASGVWTNVGTGSQVRGFNSASLTEGAATTNRLGAGTGSFVAGKLSEDGEIEDMPWTANNYTEALYSLRVMQAEFGNGDTIRFRVLRNGSTAGLTFTAVPTLNVTNTVRALASTLVDTFASSIDTLKWSPFGTTAWVAGQAEATSLDAAYSGFTSVVPYDLRESSFLVKPTPPPAAALGSRETTISLLTPAGDGVVMAIVGAPGALNILQRRRQAGANTDLTTAYVPATHAYFRLRMTGVTVYWETSPNGWEWTTLNSQTTTTNMASVTIDMTVGQWDTNEVDVAPGYFDNVNSPPPVVAITAVTSYQSPAFAAGASYQTPAGLNIATGTDLLIIVTGLTDGAATLSAPTLTCSVATGTNPTLAGYAPLTQPSTGWYGPLSAWGNWNPFVGVFTTKTATAITDFRLTFDSTDAIYGAHINVIQLNPYFGGLSTQWGNYNSTTYSAVTVPLDDGTGTILSNSINLVAAAVDGDPRTAAVGTGNTVRFHSSLGNCAFIHTDPTPGSSIDWGAVAAGAGGVIAVAISLLTYAAAATGRPKIWNGTAWVQKPLKRWSGSAWVEKPIKVWTGSTWKTVA